MSCLTLILSLAAWLGLGSLSHAAEPLPLPRGPVILTIFGSIEDTEQRAKVSGDTLVRLYNLTPSETWVALMLIDGKRLDQIAEELEVAQTTVVFHLKNVNWMKSTTTAT